MSSKKQVTTSFPLLGLLGLMFIGLKLTHQIDWSWWWVLAPFWVLPAIFFGIAGVAMLGAGLVLVFNRK